MTELQVALKEIPRYECLIEASQQHPELLPQATHVFLNFLHASDVIARLMNIHFGAHGLSHGRFLTLILLTYGEAGKPATRTPAEIAEMTQVSRATVTGLLDALEKDGYIERFPSPDDRRMVLVKLTESGSEFMNRLLPQHYRLVARVMGDLSPDELTTLGQCLTKIQQKVALLREEQQQEKV